MTNERVSSRIPRELHLELQAKAEELSISKSALIQECITENLGKVSACMKQASETQTKNFQEIAYLKTVNKAMMQRNWWQRLINKSITIEEQPHD